MLKESKEEFPIQNIGMAKHIYTSDNDRLHRLGVFKNDADTMTQVGIRVVLSEH